jgi:hypothetical protein
MSLTSSWFSPPTLVTARSLNLAVFSSMFQVVRENAPESSAEASKL